LLYKACAKITYTLYNNNPYKEPLFLRGMKNTIEQTNIKYKSDLEYTNILENLESGDYLFKDGTFIPINNIKLNIDNDLNISYSGVITHKAGSILLVSSYNQTTLKPYIHNFKSFEGCLIELNKMCGIFFKVYECRKLDIPEVLK